jgi:hypothetical protein
MIDYEGIAADVTQAVAELTGDKYEKWDKSALRVTHDFLFVYCICISDDGKEFEISAVDSQDDGIFLHSLPITSSQDELKIALGELIEDFCEYLQEIADRRNLELECNKNYDYDFN